MARIVMVAACPFPFPQGSQVLIGQLSQALQRHGHRLKLVTYHWGSGDPPAGVEIRRVPTLPGIGPVKAGPSWRKPLVDLLLVERLFQTVRDLDAQVIHTHNIEGLLAALWVRRLTGVPVVYHVHNAMGPELHTYFSTRLGRWAGRLAGRWADAHLPRRADYCILLTEHAVGYFRQRGVRRLAVVPPGIDFQMGDPVRAREQLGDGPLVVYSGNLDRYQDLDLLLEGFGLVAVSRPDARLVISTSADPGRVRDHARLKGIAAQTVFLPADEFVSVRDLLAAADVTVCPRQVCLGFPIKLLNYMAAGRPIVASKGSACGLRHLENGWVVQNGDAPAMASAITALLGDPGRAETLGAGAQRTARTEHDWDRAVEAIGEVYDRIAIGR